VPTVLTGGRGPGYARCNAARAVEPFDGAASRIRTRPRGV